MDYIDIKNLEVFAHHGVFPEENVLGQKFLVSARLYHVTSHAGMRDDLSRGLDYGRVIAEITTFLTEHTFQLIETAAERLARHLLLNFPVLHKIEITLNKPWAPVKCSVENIGVTILRSWSPVLLSLGSNQGDRVAHLCNAIDCLEDSVGVRVKKISSFMESPATGRHHQADFLNAALRIDTVLLPRELLNLLQDIESREGRVRDKKWSERPLDIDMIFYADIISEQPTLRLPHPRYEIRPFVLKPLVEIEPYFKDPRSGKCLMTLLKQ